MYLIKYVENGVITEEATEKIEDVKRSFEKWRFFLNLENNIKTIKTMTTGESLKFYKNRKRTCYIEVIVK
jgi:hypothetical protein